MTKGLPPLAWLRSFEAAARHCGFTAAADELGLTPAAVGQHVRQLEAWLGSQLFKRARAGLAPTEEAASILPAVAGALGGLEATLSATFGQRGRQVVTIRCPIAFAALWLAPHLPALAGDGLAVRVLTEVWSQAGDAGLADIEVRHGNPGRDGAAAERLTHDVLSPAFAPSVPDPAAALLTLGGLVAVQGYEHGWRRWFDEAGLDPSPIDSALWVDSEVMAAALAQTARWACLSRGVLHAQMLETGTLTAPLAPPVRVDEGFYLVGNASRAPTSAARLVRERLLAACQTT